MTAVRWAMILSASIGRLAAVSLFLGRIVAGVARADGPERVVATAGTAAIEAAIVGAPFVWPRVPAGIANHSTIAKTNAAARVSLTLIAIEIRYKSATA
jgi:hypothetical protein